jgi:hypothetical protein
MVVPLRSLHHSLDEVRSEKEESGKLRDYCAIGIGED